MPPTDTGAQCRGWVNPGAPPRGQPTPRWQLLLEPQGRPGAEQMARDAQLLEEADCTGHAFLRLYRFDPPCLSLGRNEAAGGYDRAAIARWGLDVVRRPSGGGSVWHEHEVTYAVAAPVATFGGLRRAYHAIHERLAAALRSLGANATLAPPPTAPFRAVPRPREFRPLLRGPRWRRNPRRRAQARRLRPDAPGCCVPATRIHSAGRVAGDGHSRKPKAARPK